MKTSISYTKARNDLSHILNHVCSTHEPVVIERRSGGNTVILSEEDWNSMNETLYLISSSKDFKAITETVNLEDCSDSLSW
ncbi:MAG: type II toxin-antitoxin system Phd/YefM family antitoxin [Puniceicoccales bacterium]|jgi:antitoxin YefM|nr:type II toxin-antitoxin system Phd/YefM family antitoxin [Puniceicoccales bacterium]